ncbi:hypothetical protein ACFWPK_22475 [Nocardia sp. NPDC058519]|uniref:hypothetical protein n=1 Tax=Nocardia sp. NPDC058519 TaxID=3346535 RepID=UPI0036636691
MKTATVHIPSVDGYFGVAARCFQLDPPRTIDGHAHEYVTVVVQQRVGPQAAEVKVYPAQASGASASLQLTRRVGSCTLDGDPDIEGCYWIALQLLGGYLVRAQDA